jgi:hypothetical protein
VEKEHETSTHLLKRGRREGSTGPTGREAMKYAKTLAALALILAIAGCGSGVESAPIHEVTNTNPGRYNGPVPATAPQAVAPAAPDQPFCSQAEIKWNAAEAGRHESQPFSKLWNEWSQARREAEQSIRSHHCVQPKGMRG